MLRGTAAGFCSVPDVIAPVRCRSKAPRRPGFGDIQEKVCFIRYLRTYTGLLVHRLIAIVLIATTSLALGHAPCCLLHVSGCAAATADSSDGCCTDDVSTAREAVDAGCETARDPSSRGPSSRGPGDFLCPHCGVRHPKKQDRAPAGSGCSCACPVWRHRRRARP